MLCYPTIFLTCLFQFETVGNFVRKNLRFLIRQLHFIDDKIAFFDIPALEIDTDVDGLMVLRGITFSLSTLSFVVHGVEVGIKLSDDMELAIQTEKVTVSLFRNIKVGDCFANLKGGQYEMTFGSIERDTHDEEGDAVFIENTPLLQAASGGGDSGRPSIVKMTSAFTDGNPPDDASINSGMGSMEKITLGKKDAAGRYLEALELIEETSTILEARKHVKKLNKEYEGSDERTFDNTDENAIRAAICSQVHQKPSVPHPPKRSIKVSTLQNLMPPWVRKLMHRLPLLLRLLLNPLSYFHPVHISSITATASGKWIEFILVDKIFKDYGERDTEIRNLKKRIASWLSDANFAIELGDMTGIAHVPLIPSYDIHCQLGFDDVMAYRALPKEVNLKQVLRLGGAHATFIIPSFLLPHHEHILPPVPSREQKRNLEKDVEDADGMPKTVQAEHELEQADKDEANVKISAHASFPACFDQELLDFIAALVKATKVVEMEKQDDPMEEEVHGFKDFSKALNKSMKDGVKKAVVDGVVNDRWIAKMVGKVTKKLEAAQGDIGYSGDIPVELEIYRTDYLKTEGDKLLP